MTTTEQVPDAVPTPTDITITAMEPEEYPLLAEFLYQAIHVLPGTPTPDRSVVELPELRRYIEGFGRFGDACMVAKVETSDRPLIVGAAWARIFPRSGHRLRHHRHGNAGSLHILVSRLARPRHRPPP